MHWAKELVLCVSVSPLLEHGHPFRPGWYVLCGNWDREDPCECPENLIFQMRMPYEYGRPFSSHLSSLRVKESRTLGPRQDQETIHTDGETRLSGVTQVGGEEKWGFVLGSFIHLFVLRFTQQIFVAARSVPGSLQGAEEMHYTALALKEHSLRNKNR